MKKEQKQEFKKIKQQRKDRIKNLKQEFKDQIKNADSSKKKTLKQEYKNKFKFGIEPKNDEYIINVKNLTKYFATASLVEKVLDDVNLKIKKGTINIILGPSGSGKSTLLNILSGLLDFEYGDVIVSNRNFYFLNEKRRTKFRADNVAFVFQSYNLIQTLTALENIKVGFNLKNKEKQNLEISEILNFLKIDEIKNKYPYQLSGGQQQRVSIARAISKNPDILFADEPTGALDNKRGEETLQLLYDINKKFNTTIIMVTHNNAIIPMADNVFEISSGKIKSVKTNPHPIKPKDIKW